MSSNQDYILKELSEIPFDEFKSEVLSKWALPKPAFSREELDGLDYETYNKRIMVAIPEGYRRLECLEMIELTDLLWDDGKREFVKIEKGSYFEYNKADRAICVIRKRGQNEL